MKGLGITQALAMSLLATIESEKGQEKPTEIRIAPTDIPWTESNVIGWTPKENEKKSHQPFYAAVCNRRRSKKK